MTIATRVRPLFVNRVPSITYWVRGEPDARGRRSPMRWRRDSAIRCGCSPANGS